MKRVLNVGGYSREIPLPDHYDEWQQVMLDIDPDCNPDILLDARNLTQLAPEQFDAVYCSHCLEHFYPHDGHKVLAGFLHVLKPDGVAEIIVPDIATLMQEVVAKNLELDSVLYTAPCGPIMVQDMLYGLGEQIRKTGQDYFAHKTGFSERTLFKALYRAGFREFFSRLQDLQIVVYAFTKMPADEVTNHFHLYEAEGMPPC